MKKFIIIHPLVPFFLVFIWFTPWKYRFFILYGFIFLHELSHMALSLILGERPSSLRIMPWGCMLTLKDIPKKRNACIIFLAGPLFNLCMYILKIFPKENLSLALFNLMPVMPLDGGAISALLFGNFSFYISVIFILLLSLFCIYHHAPIFLPVILSCLLYTGEKNKLDKTICNKIMRHFNSKK